MLYSQEIYEFIVRDQCIYCEESGNYPVRITQGKVVDPTFKCEHCKKMNILSSSTAEAIFDLYEKHESMKMRRLAYMQGASDNVIDNNQTRKSAKTSSVLNYVPFLLTLYFGFDFATSANGSISSFGGDILSFVLWTLAMVASWKLLQKHDKKPKDKSKRTE